MGKRAPNGFGSIRKVQKNGKFYWEGRYTDPILHKQQYVSGTTYKICVQKLREKQAKIFTGQYVPPQRQTLGAYLDTWLESRVNLEPTTKVVYERCIRLYIKPHLGRIKLQELRRTHCQQMIHQIANDPKRKKQLTAGTIRNISRTLCKALADAKRSDLIGNNPASELELPRMEKKPPKVLQSAEQIEFLKTIQGSPYEQLYKFALFTGVRISEALGLQWKNIDMQSGEILIDKQLTRKTGNSVERKLKGTKNHVHRTIIAPPYVLDVLRVQSVRQKEMRLKAGPLWQNTDGLVFCKEDGLPLPHNTITKNFKSVAQKLGRPELCFHDLRHTYVTDSLKAGVDIKTVSALAGHSSIVITADTYAAASIEMKQSAADRRQAEYEKKNHA